MDIQYSITETDYVNSSKLAAVASRKQVVWLIAGGFGLLLLGVFGPDSLKPMGYCGLIFGILGYFITLHVISPWQARRHYRNYKSIHKPLNIELADGGFIIKTENGQNNVKWENLLKWREDKNYVLVYLAPRMFYVIPKRIAEFGFDVEGICQLLRDNVGVSI